MSRGVSPVQIVGVSMFKRIYTAATWRVIERLCEEFTLQSKEKLLLGYALDFFSWPLAEVSMSLKIQTIAIQHHSP